jgi:hypothetical protein
LRELTLRLTSKSRALLLLLVQLIFPAAAVHARRPASSPPGSLKAQQQVADNPVTPLVFGKNLCKTLALNRSDLYEFEVKEVGQPGYIHVEVIDSGSLWAGIFFDISRLA